MTAARTQAALHINLDTTHGGMSTGPKTPEGRQRSRQAIADYWAKPENREAAAARIRARLADSKWVEADRARREQVKRAHRAEAYYREMLAALGLR